VEKRPSRRRRAQFFKAFERFAAALGGSEAARIAGRVVVYGGDESQARSQGEILSWREIDAFDWTGGGLG